LPDTDAVPTVVPPVEQLVGAEDCGPKTLIVIVPVGLEPPANVLEIEPVAMGVPVASVVGPLAVSVGLAFPTTVSDIAEPQKLEALLLFESPP
jgi:hypothetical protein